MVFIYDQRVVIDIFCNSAPFSFMESFTCYKDKILLHLNSYLYEV